MPQYFKAYGKLAGMTGTAGNQASHWIFHNLYGLETIAIPTHRPIIRKDLKPKIFNDEQQKRGALIDKTIELNRKGQPVLVGTASILESELISGLLKQKAPRIKHQVLNAKFHKKEAGIIKKAGKKGAVTIATNMAGRGTDIALGKGVKELGGLSVIGLSPNLSRRIDDQLKGRAGRQGDPGISQIYVALSWFGEDTGSDCLKDVTFNPDGSIKED
ncbi:MAG TPA: preprotein translocase subunit SecA, partial [Candidatus Omnitrophica bacterium]|nr:preprotein translocase subunit SecA [Candidatus Omnitrophota bacterium]